MSAFRGCCACAWCLNHPAIDGDSSDEEFEAFIKAHPLDPMQQEEVEAAVQRLRKRFRGEPGPALGI